MKEKRWILLTAAIGALVLVLTVTWNLSPKTAEAACGASTSSCTTCHEVRGEDSVANKGDWHTQHAFSDVCQACHLGVGTENDKVKAHAGMLANPLSQPEQSCSSCHPSDIAARVAKYGGNTTGGSNGTGVAATSTTPGVSGNPQGLDQKPAQGSSSWLAWVMGILDVLILLALVAEVWRWKKGVWPWANLGQKGQ